MNRLAALTAAAILAAGCGGADADTDAGSGTATNFAAIDSAGVELLVTTSVDPPPSSGWVIGPDPRVVFGAGSSPPVEFYRIAGMARLGDGRVVVLDEGDKTLTFFTSTGELEHEVGREGDGPGEFRAPTGPVAMDGDSVLVFDQRHFRFSLFGPDGSLVREQRLDPPAEDRQRLAQYGPADIAGDTVLMIATSWTIPYREERRYTHEVPNLVYLTDGSYVGEVGEPTTLELERSADAIAMPLFSFPTRAVAENGRMYVPDRGRHEVRMYPHDGGLARVYRLEHPGRPVTEADVEAHARLIIERIEDPESRRRALENIRAQSRADSFPSISRVLVDAGGNVWVGEYRTPTEWEAARAEASETGEVRLAPGTSVFAADGEWLGTATMPPGFQPQEIGADYALGYELDELGVQRAVEYSVTR